jgi:DNA-binding NtrC family response regulator
MKLKRVVSVSRREELTRLAGKVGCEVFAADNLTEAIETIQSVTPELILLDYQFGHESINQLLASIGNNPADYHVIIVGDGSAETAAINNELSKTTCCNCLTGPDDIEQLEKIIQQMVLDKSNNGSIDKNTNNFFADDLAASAGIVGHSKAITEMLKMIRLVAVSRCNPILIIGETGSGKELAAKAVHNIRGPNNNFVALNCSALTAALLESELFGHVKGAFTGADRDKTGLLELAGTGTLFLDEISEMPTDLQAKLLRVIQEKEFRKVGGTDTLRCRATIIASSNRNLHQEVEANRFRSDLFYRLNICPIIIEPLRSQARKDDIPLLARYFLRTSSLCPDKHNKIASITALALESLQTHHWPGNVRELQNVIERAILLETTDKIGLNNILIHTNYWSAPSADKTSELKNFSLEKAERELIARALQETGWQKTQTASLLGISRATLYAKLEQYNLGKNSLNSANVSSKDSLTEAAFAR